MGDFHCKEVNWKEWEKEGNADSWGSALLNMALEK